MLRLLFFFNDTATTEIYTLSLHDALPILCQGRQHQAGVRQDQGRGREELPGGLAEVQHGRRQVLRRPAGVERQVVRRSEEHTSELQSRQYLVCRLLLEKKQQYKRHQYSVT